MISYCFKRLQPKVGPNNRGESQRSKMWEQWTSWWCEHLAYKQRNLFHCCTFFRRKDWHDTFFFQSHLFTMTSWMAVPLAVPVHVNNLSKSAPTGNMARRDRSLTIELPDILIHWHKFKLKLILWAAGNVPGSYIAALSWWLVCISSVSLYQHHTWYKSRHLLKRDHMFCPLGASSLTQSFKQEAKLSFKNRPFNSSRGIQR